MKPNPTVLVLLASAAVLAFAAPIASAAASPAANGKPAANGRPTGPIELRSTYAPGSCVDVNARTHALVLWSCHGGANQKFEHHEDGTLRFQGRCLGAAGNGLELRECDGAPDTRWRFGSNGEVRNGANQCVDIAGGIKTNGTSVLAWNCHGGPNQKWTRAEGRRR